jgi:hypothetical protein
MQNAALEARLTQFKAQGLSPSVDAQFSPESFVQVLPSILLLKLLSTIPYQQEWQFCSNLE